MQCNRRLQMKNERRMKKKQRKRSTAQKHRRMKLKLAKHHSMQSWSFRCLCACGVLIRGQCTLYYNSARFFICIFLLLFRFCTTQTHIHITILRYVANLDALSFVFLNWLFVLNLFHVRQVFLLCDISVLMFWMNTPRSPTPSFLLAMNSIQIPFYKRCDIIPAC